MSLDLVFIVTYECPGCHVALEDRSSGASAWLRCPRCGRASVAPDHQRWDRSATSEKNPSSTGESFVIGELPDPLRPRSMAPLPAPPGSKTSNLRLLLGIGFFASLFLCVFSLLDSNLILSSITGMGSLVCLILLFLPAGRVPPQ